MDCKSAMSNEPRRLQYEEEDDLQSLFLSLPYLGKEAEQIVRRTKKKLRRTFKENVKLNVFFQYTKFTFFTSNKDRIPLLSNSCIVYQYSCPGCSAKYIGKTESTLFNRTGEHGWKQKDSAICKHFGECPGWAHIKGILQFDSEPVDDRSLQMQTVRENTSILSRSDNWRVLAFKESLAIKERKPSLNHGIKAAKNLCLF